MLALRRDRQKVGEGGGAGGSALPVHTMGCLRFLVVAMGRRVEDASQVARDLGGAPVLRPHLRFPVRRHPWVWAPQYPRSPGRLPGTESRFCARSESRLESPREQKGWWFRWHVPPAQSCD